MNGHIGGGKRFRLLKFAGLPVILAAWVVMLPAFFISGDEAAALDPSEWQSVRSYIDGYITAQFQLADEGEAGYLLDASTLKARIDSNNDGVYLGEGDDVHDAPVLVDVLSNQPVIIPATAQRCFWNSTCLGLPVVSAIKTEVDAHEAAGFSTDVAVYCATGHTESPVTGGYGAIAQAGGLGGSTPPRVLALKWGRAGWNTGSKSYLNIYPPVTPVPGVPYLTYPTNPNCPGVTPDSELVRCTAEWALAPLGGNAGSGVSTPLSSMQVIDIRSGNVQQTANGGYLPSLHIPIETLFNTGLQFVNPASPPKKLFVGRTQHVAGMAAMGAEMLGYDSTFLKYGLADYNNLYGEWFTGGAGYPLIAPPQPDVSGPVQSNVTVSNFTDTAVDISRDTDEPATMKVEIGTAPGIYTNVTNDTVLNRNKTIPITGLVGGNTYYYRVTSYDGMANASAPVEGIIGIPIIDPCDRPDIVPVDPAGFWASYADFLARELSVSLRIENRGIFDAVDVQITGDSSSGGVMLVSQTPVAVGNIAPGSGAPLVLRYHLPAGAGTGFEFVTHLTGSASNWCGAIYTYP